MKTGDKEAFDLLSKTAIWLLPDGAEFSNRELDPWWKINRPTFGAVALGTRAEIYKRETQGDTLVPRFLYFTKYKPQLAPPDIQRTNQPDVYLVSVYWNSEKLKLSAPYQFPVAVSSDGEVQVLRTRLYERKEMRSKRGSYRGSFSIPVQRWGISEALRDWAKEHEAHTAQYLSDLFVLIANAYIEAQSGMAEIRVSKSDLACAFNLDIKRVPSFFKDRDRIGHKRIFHIVRAHIRKDGTPVRFHFRGARSFDWNGYRVNITIAGLHRSGNVELQTHAADFEMIDPVERNKWIDTADLGKAIHRSYERAARLPNRQDALRRMASK